MLTGHGNNASATHGDLSNFWRVEPGRDSFWRFVVAQCKDASLKYQAGANEPHSGANMANPFRYYVELRNKSGMTIGTHLYAHSDYAAMELAAERNPGYRALFARRLS